MFRNLKGRHLYRAQRRRSTTIIVATILLTTLSTSTVNPAFANIYRDLEPAATVDSYEYYDRERERERAYSPELGSAYEDSTSFDSDYDADYEYSTPDYWPSIPNESYDSTLTPELLSDFEEWRSNFPRLDFNFGDPNEIAHGLLRDTWQRAEFTLSNVSAGYQQFSGEMLDIRGRGNSTWNLINHRRDYLFHKLPFRIRFDQPQVMFDAEHPSREWTLIANHFDHSLMRSYMAYRIAGNLSGMNDAPFARLVDVYWNGDFRGVYMFSIQHSEAASRVPLNANQDPLLSEFLVELDFRVASENHQGSNWVMVDGIPYEIRYPGSVNGDDRAARQRRGSRVIEIISNVNRLIAARSPEIWRYIDKDSFVDFYIMAELSKDRDVIHSSQFFQILLDSQGNQIIHMGPVWDLDLGFGDGGTDTGCVGLQATHTRFDYRGLWAGLCNPWFRGLLNYPEFREAVGMRLLEIAGETGPIEEALNHVQWTALAHEESFNRNFARWPILGRYGNNTSIPTFMGHVNFLTEWTRQRTQWMLEYFSIIAPPIAVLPPGTAIPPLDVDLIAPPIGLVPPTTTFPEHPIMVLPPGTDMPAIDVEVARWFGDTRIETAIEISQRSFADNSQPDIAFITNAWNFPDALAASAVAGQLGGPVLLVDPNPARNIEVIAELNRLRPKRVVVLGSENAVSDNIFDQINTGLNYPDRPLLTSQDRWAGRTRIETAIEISQRSFAANSQPDIAFITNAWNFPDALAASAVAGQLGGPVLLVDPNPARNIEVIAELNRLRPKRVVVLGSENAVSDNIFDQINTGLSYPGRPLLTSQDRWAGRTRIETAIEISQRSFAANSQPDIAFITNAWNFPDALAASAVAGQLGGPVLLVDPNPARNIEVIAELNRLRPKRVVVLGSSDAVSEAVYHQKREAVNVN